MSIETIVTREFMLVDAELTADEVLAAENGTGYFDGLMRGSALFGETVAKFKDRHKRIGFVLYTAVGNVVVFQRYRGDHRVWVANVPQPLRGIFPPGALTDATVEHLISGVHDQEKNVLATMVDRIVAASK